MRDLLPTSMFVAIQFPSADPRPFLPDMGDQLCRPNWGDPAPSSEFVRSFGPVLQRNRGGIHEWPGEGKYCSVNNAIRFQSPLLSNTDSEWPSKQFKVACTFRRLLSDGRFALSGGFNVNHRLEFGFALRRPRKLAGLDESQLDKAISLIKGIKIRPALHGFPSDYTPIMEAGKCLASLLTASTTRHGKSSKDKRYSIASATPLAIVEYRVPLDAQAPPSYAKHIFLDNKTIHLSYAKPHQSPLGIGTWFIGCQLVVDGMLADPESIRRLRMHILRIHAERETMKQVLRWIARGVFETTTRGPPLERLQSYLNQATRILLKKNVSGIPQSEILGVATGAYDLVTEGEAETLLKQLEEIRPNIRRKVSEMAHSSGSGIFFSSTHPNLKEITVINQTITLGSGVTIHGSFTSVAANQITNSFQNIGSSDASSEIKTSLEDLHKNIAGLIEKLPASLQESAARDLESFTREATSTAPRKAWWELSASGLLSAVKTLGDLADPVVNVVNKIVSFLATR